MYKLFAMNNAGTEFLIAECVKRADMALSMAMIAKAGLTPIARRLQPSPRTITKNALAFYV